MTDDTIKFKFLVVQKNKFKKKKRIQVHTSYSASEPFKVLMLDEEATHHGIMGISFRTVAIYSPF